MLNLECCGALAKCGVENYGDSIAGLTFNGVIEVWNADAHSEILRARGTLQRQKPHRAGVEPNVLVSSDEIEAHRRFERDGSPTRYVRRASDDCVHKRKNVGVSFGGDDKLPIAAVRP